MSTTADQQSDEAVLDTVVERFQLKSLVEACLLVEEGVATIKDIDMGMMMGAGIIPGPFAAADERGLDEILSALDKAQDLWGEWFAPPVLLRRLVAQGRLGKKTGQGFYAYPSPDAEQKETLLLDWRDEGRIAILWLNRPPMNPLSPTVINELAETWKQVDGKARAMIIASSNTFTFAAGADIKEFTRMDEETGAKMVEQAHKFMRGMEKSRTATIAAVNSIALGGGCELAMACDFRIAAESATFGQPEINLGIIPGFGGTQRLPRLVGEAKALEMNLVGEPIDAWKALEIGLATEVVPDHELFDTALAWARKLADQAPIAIEQIKKVSANGDLDKGLEHEAHGFAKAFQSEDAKEGIGAFLGKRKPQFKGE
jgi:enoyl-CoA hydratase / 3-hydroxyacyl-CoA dehydrogenase